MKYSYEYKKKCVEMYREGKWAETPEGVSQKRFHDNIREWVRVEEAKGPEGLQQKKPEQSMDSRRKICVDSQSSCRRVGDINSNF